MIFTKDFPRLHKYVGKVDDYFWPGSAGMTDAIIESL